MKTGEKILTKNSSVYRIYQAPLTGWMHLIICTQLIVHPYVDWCKSTQDEGHSQHFSIRIILWTWWLSILRMLHHTNTLCKRLRVYERLDQKWLDIHFLFLSKNDINPVLKILVKFLSFNNSAKSSSACSVSPPEISTVYDLWFQLFLNQSPKSFWNCTWSL